MNLNRNRTKRLANSNTILIRPLRGWVPINLSELWAYRDLLYFLVWRELKVRYKQTVLGITWAVIQPFFMMIIFNLFFGRFVKIPSEGIPYPLFSYAALLPWMLFSEGVTRSTNSLIANDNIIKKVYFPRLILPISGIVSPLVDFGFSFAVFIGLMFYFGFGLTIRILWLPVFLMMALITALAVGLWLSAMNVRYRDVRYTISFLIQFWFFASPVVYSSATVPKDWQLIYALNPMVAVIEGFRWVLLGTNPPAFITTVSMVAVLAILILGLFYFRRMEKIFADEV
jgi:lipopolysaccharide transport system permease protein